MKEEESDGSGFVRLSRTQKKRADEARQVLAHRIVALRESELKRLPLSPDALAAARTAAAIPQLVAHRRAVMYLAALLRAEDEAGIRQALEDPSPEPLIDPAIERADDWRNRLLRGEADCLDEIAELRPELDWTRIRQLIRNAGAEPGSGRAASRLREYLIELATEPEA